MNKFFVYGTLMSGCSNHRVIPAESIEKIEPATISNMKLYSYRSGSFPCMVEGKNKVIGEIITIKEEHLQQALKMMDRLEGYYGPDRVNFYNREQKIVSLWDGTPVLAYTYLFNNNDPRELGKLIKDGDFRKWRYQS